MVRGLVVLHALRVVQEQLRELGLEYGILHPVLHLRQGALLLLQGLQLFQEIAPKAGKGEAGFLGKVLRVRVHHIGPAGGAIHPEVVGMKGRLILGVVPEGEGTGMNEGGLPIHLQHLI